MLVPEVTEEVVEVTEEEIEEKEEVMMTEKEGTEEETTKLEKDDMAEEEAEVLKSSFPRNVVISHLGRTLTHYLIYLIAVPYSSDGQFERFSWA